MKFRAVFVCCLLLICSMWASTAKKDDCCCKGHSTQVPAKQCHRGDKSCCDHDQKACVHAPKKMAGTFIDPVCGEDVDPAKAVKTEYKGKTYAFCCKQCADTFAANPTAFAPFAQSVGKDTAK
jgi:YHS domain-containing protein